MSGYSPVPQNRFEAPEPTLARTSSPAPSSLRAPAFKGSGMKLGSKKTKQAESLDVRWVEKVWFTRRLCPLPPSRSRAHCCTKRYERQPTCC